MNKDQIPHQKYIEAMQRAALQNASPKPSVEARLDWLEADSAAQRMAILKLERACRLLLKIVATLWLMCAMLAWMALS